MVSYQVGYSEHVELDKLVPLRLYQTGERWEIYREIHGLPASGGNSGEQPVLPELAWAGTMPISWGDMLSVTSAETGGYRAVGSGQDDWITGTEGSDILEGKRADDKLEGGGGDDRLIGGQGADDLFGGEGVDTAVFAGNLASFRFADASGEFHFKVVDERESNAEGIDRIGFDVELLEFDDVTIDLRETHAPEAADDRFVLKEDEKSDILSVVENDTDFDVLIGLQEFEVTFVNTTAIGEGPTTITLASGARLTMWADGRFVYDPNGKFDKLAAGKTAKETFKYTVTDGSGETSTATVDLVIKGENDAPVVKNVKGAVGENGSAITLTANFTDADTADEHTFLMNTTGTKGSVVNNLNGTFSYSPNGKFEHLAQGQTATDTFKYTVSDGHGGIVSKTMTVTITGANDAPVAQNVAANANEDGPAVLINASFTDADTIDTHTFTINTAGTLGQVVNNNNGTFSYNPNAQFEALNTGQTATDTFTYTVDDGHGGLVTKTVTVTIVGLTD